MQYLVALVEDTPSSSLFYMREFGVTLHGSPVFYRYIDWLITVTLQMIEFYLIPVHIFHSVFNHGARSRSTKSQNKPRSTVS